MRAFPGRILRLLLLSGLLGTGCAPPPSLPVSPPCPIGFAEDAPRLEQALALLARTRPGHSLAAELTRRPLRGCFGPARPALVTETGLLLLDEAPGPGETAARLAHLAHHLTHGAPWREEAPTTSSCAARVRAALAAEADALALELEVRDALAVTTPRVRYPFEDALRSAAPSRWPALILQHLETHPDGGPGLDALGRIYTTRCRKEALRHPPHRESPVR